MLVENMSFSDNYSLIMFKANFCLTESKDFFWKIIKVPISLMSLILESLFLSFISICYKSTFWVLPLSDQRHLCEWYLFPLFFPPISFCLPQCLTHWCLHFYLFIKYSAAHYIVALPLFLNNTSNVHIETLLLHWFSNVLR